MRIFVTGGTGFVGGVLVRLLAATGHQVIALVRPGSESKLLKDDRVKLQPGNGTDAQALEEGISGCDAVIHLIGIIREDPDRGVTFASAHVETTRKLLDAASAQGVKRYLHMSSNGAGAETETAYRRTKWQAEEAVRASPLDWTIFRPSLIYGPGSDFINLLAAQIRKLPIVPVIGDGQYEMQPVAVRQVAETYLKALTRPETTGRTYHLGGGSSYSFDEILDIIGAALGKKTVHKAHQPVTVVRPVVKLLEDVDHFPLSADQMAMLLAGDVCDPRPWAEAFDIVPADFAADAGTCFPKD